MEQLARVSTTLSTFLNHSLASYIDSPAGQGGTSHYTHPPFFDSAYTISSLIHALIHSNSYHLSQISYACS